MDAGEKLTSEQFSKLVDKDASRQDLILALECGVVVDIDFHIVDGPPCSEPDMSRTLVWKKAA
ncbi:hypothetical protein DB30_02006 [Enhygromyxa salina]|uniref:Uncharacterized protein n=1 Tax=Enhygromyxa salina TaxID=215803 RepID=A0A0C1ZKR8_9BACT|nr:hypothetical protein DB30_02006 [Enhygromyxa salina]